MIFSRHIYWTILLRILLILATSGTGLWLIISQRGIIIGTLLIICSLFQIGGIVTYLNNINRKLRLFFDAIEDRDNTFSYPEQGISEEQQQLNRSLNRINALLAQTKMDYQKQEHFYRSLLEKVPNGIIAWNNSKKIIFVNSTALTLLNIESLTLYSQLENILQNEKNRKRLSLSQSQMKLQDETITLLSIQDIDDRLNENESESWSKLSHVLTHEIMNTIAPIISLSQTLASYPEISEKGIRGLHIIQAQSERLMEFTESFRHLSYLPQPEKRLFSYPTYYTIWRNCFKPIFKKTISPLHSGAPRTDDDRRRRKATVTSVSQSVEKRHAGIGGASAWRAFPASRTRRIYSHRHHRQWSRYSSRNYGQSIHPLFTTKSEGTGIGLSLCKEIIRRHEGHLAIKESRAGKTVFHIELP